jgi:hypothetical protein
MVERPTVAGRACTLFFVLAVLTLIPLTPRLHAQEKDPYLSAPKDRKSASLPTPYGFILGGGIPVWHTTLGDGDAKTVSRFDAAAYYDTWLVGYSMKDYGNMFMIMARSTGRDVYSGYYFEFGSKNIQAAAQEELGSFGSTAVDTITATRTLLGLGFRGMSGFSESASLALLYDVSLGITKTSVSSETSLDFYMYSELGIGSRIPISTFALTIGADGFFGILPAEGVLSSEPSLYLGFGLHTSLALNLSN